MTMTYETTCLPSCLSLFTTVALKVSSHTVSLHGMSTAQTRTGNPCQVIRSSERIIGLPLPPLDDIFRTRCLRRACGILKDETHPANHLFTLLPSGRRYRATTARTSRLQNSFIPRAITEL